MRDRLIELLQRIETDYWDECVAAAEDGYKCAPHFGEFFADRLLAEGIIVPPCKVGDTVYTILSKKVQEYIVHAIEHTENVITVKCHNWLAEREGLLHKHIAYFDMTKFGKTVFLTRAEAEKGLAERSENGT